MFLHHVGTLKSFIQDKQKRNVIPAVPVHGMEETSVEKLIKE